MAVSMDALRLMLLLNLLATAALAQTPDEAAQRCTRRISQTLGIGYRASLTSLAGATPQARVRTWLESRDAITTFAGFINSRFNSQPGANLAEEGVPAAVRFILTNKKPWKELFVGRYTINHTNNIIMENATVPALGYFGSLGWQKRYLGNAPDGLMLSAGYRTMQNVVGFKLIPSPQNGEGDATATGRERAECRGCHFDSPYGLDLVARLLPRKIGMGGGARAEKVPVTPQTLFNGIQVRDHEHLLEVLTASDAFLFRTCRLAFEFVYGRPESACEAPMFDRCVDAFARTGMMQDALASYLEDPQYCEAVP